jgi:hypothetical protein
VITFLLLVLFFIMGFASGVVAILLYITSKVSQKKPPTPVKILLTLQFTDDTTNVLIDNELVTVTHDGLTLPQATRNTAMAVFGAFGRILNADIYLAEEEL